MRFPSTRRERGGGKKERRESTRTRTGGEKRARAAAAYVCMRCTRVHASVARRLHREETHVRAEGIERERERESTGERETKTERERRKRGRQGDGSCVCTTRRVYQATSVVTAIVPTTSPAGRHPRSIRLSSFPSRPPWSSASCRIPSDFFSFSGALGVFLYVEGAIPTSPIFLELFLPPCLKFLASLSFLPPYLRCDKRLYFRAKSEFLGDEFSSEPVYHYRGVSS